MWSRLNETLRLCMAPPSSQRAHSDIRCWLQAAAEHVLAQERCNEARAGELREQAAQLQAAQQAWDGQQAQERGAASQARTGP